MNILACGIFGSVSGSSAATCATVAKIALPELKRRGYDEKLALGSLAGAETLDLRARGNHPDADVTLVRPAEALADLDGRALARAVGPQQRQHRAAADLERQPVDDGAAVVALHQAGDGQGRAGCRHASSLRSAGWCPPVIREGGAVGG